VTRGGLYFWLALSLFSVFGLDALAASRLRPELTLNGPWITVGDLLDPAPDTVMAKIKVKRLVAPGKSLEISRDQLFLKLREARLGRSLPELSQGSSLVHASAKRVPGTDLKAFAEKYIKDRLANLSGVAEVEVTVSSPVRDVLVPERLVKFQITPRAGQNWRGNVVLRVVLLQTLEDGTELEVGQAVLPFVVKVTQSLLLASRAIRRGELISDVNTKISALDSSLLSFDGYTQLAQAQGLKARLPIPADKPIDPASLERPSAIKRGDIVKLIVRSGLVAVEVSAKAMRDAAVGDSIPVEVQDSKKQLQARVLDQRTVVSDTR
jgi:flagella basal body P-ring formation protein FlgA